MAGWIKVGHPVPAAALRAHYEKTWGRPWPEDDEYLATLWGEELADLCGEGGPAWLSDVEEQTLDRMRECHEFVPGPAASIEISDEVAARLRELARPGEELGVTLGRMVARLQSLALPGESLGDTASRLAAGE